MSRVHLRRVLEYTGIAGLVLSCLLASTMHSARAARPINWIDRGVLATEQGHYDDAIVYFTSAIDARQSIDVAYYDRAHTYWLTGRLREADADLTRAIALRPLFAQAYELRARVRDTQGDIAAALVDAAQAAAQDTAALPNRLTYAILLGKANRNSDAAKQYEAVLRQSPQTAVALRNLAAIRLVEHRPDEAIKLLRQLDSISPGDADVATDTATLFLSEHRYAEALAWINAHPSKSARAAELSARALHGLAKDADALTALPEATASDSLETTRFRGLIMLANRHCAEAAQSLHLATAQNDTDPVLWRDTGTADLCAHNRSSAISAYTKSIVLDPTDPLAHRYLANALRESGSVNDAISEYRVALHIGGPNAYILKTVGVLEYLQGQHAKGRTDFAAGCAQLAPTETSAIQDCQRQLPQMRI